VFVHVARLTALPRPGAFLSRVRVSHTTSSGSELLISQSSSNNHLEPNQD
jgi:hypothetical protein